MIIKTRQELVLQQDTMDCGPSCLAMIAGRYGLHPDIEALRKACALGIDGVSLLGIRAPASKSDYLKQVLGF
jgi:ABC transporter, ATP-binding protein